MKNSKPLPPASYINECLSYNELTGALFWLKRPRVHFETARGWNIFNTRYAGKEAFTYVDKNGYKCGSLDGITYFAFRIIWKIKTGTDPDTVDHVDRNPTNDRWVNLRSANHSNNRINSVMSKGIIFEQRLNKWRAYIRVNYKLVHLGVHVKEADAKLARKLAELKYFGEFAP
jgi:HNH endonuclease